MFLSAIQKKLNARCRIARTQWVQFQPKFNFLNGTQKHWIGSLLNGYPLSPLPSPWLAFRYSQWGKLFPMMSPLTSWLWIFYHHHLGIIQENYRSVSTAKSHIFPSWEGVRDWLTTIVSSVLVKILFKSRL